MAKVKSNILIQIPDYLVRNVDVRINATDFALICLLKNQAFINRGYDLRLDHDVVKRILHIKDSRVLKNSFARLYEYKIILNEVTNLPRRSLLDLSLNKDMLQAGKHFAQLPSTVLGKIGDIGNFGVRLLFYYESYISRSMLTKQFCYTGYETICRDLSDDASTSISPTTLTKYNSMLRDKKLLKIEKNVIHTDFSYDENDRPIFIKYNNHYTPILENI